MLKTLLTKINESIISPLFSPKDTGATVEIIEDSIFNGSRLTTFRCTYWRPIHAEFMTHRDFSRGAGSNRAVPTMHRIKQVWNNPCGAIVWGKNKGGMQAGEDLSMLEQSVCNLLHYHILNKVAVGMAYPLLKMGVHKQWANRYLEPFERIEVLVSATSYNNFFILRDHADAQPEIRQLAQKMKKLLKENQPRTLQEGEWHLPFVTKEERKNHSTEQCVIMSTARSARVSYGLFNGKPANLGEDKKLYHKLVVSEPMHSSPTEHPAQAVKGRWANFSNFRQHRWQLETRNLPDAIKNILPEPKPVFDLAEKYPHYYIDVQGLDWVDVYELFRLFGTQDHELEHTIKKLLCAGKRGAKDKLKDLKEGYHTLGRLIYAVEHGKPQED